MFRGRSHSRGSRPVRSSHVRAAAHEEFAGHMRGISSYRTVEPAERGESACRCPFVVASRGIRCPREHRPRFDRKA